MKKNRSKKFKRTLKALSKAAFDTGLSFQKFSEVLIILKEATQKQKQPNMERLALTGKRGGTAGRALRQKFLKGSGIK